MTKTITPGASGRAASTLVLSWSLDRYLDRCRLIDQSGDLAGVWDRRPCFGDIFQASSVVGRTYVDHHSLCLERVAVVCWRGARTDVCGGLKPVSAGLDTGGWPLYKPASPTGVNREDKNDDLLAQSQRSGCPPGDHELALRRGIRTVHHARR